MTDMVARDPATLFARPEVHLDRRSDGTILLTSPQILKPYARCVGEYLLYWADRAPNRPFLCERAQDGAWRSVTYGQALEEVLRVAGWLVEREIPPSRPVAILSDNSVRHAFLMLAAMHVGVAAMPISSAYCLASRDFHKLKSIIQRTDPAVIYVEDHQRYSAALAAIDELHSAQLLLGPDDHRVPAGALRIDELPAVSARATVARAFDSVTPDTVAKLLFTSGSTAEPKGVITTQRMLCSNQQARAQVWPFLEYAPPVILDWLPWNHTFGGSHNFNLILRNGGTLYIDSGRPVPALFPQTVANLREVATTIYFNVPRGYELLIRDLQADAALRRQFFSRLQVIFYGAASLPSNLWEALVKLSIETTGTRVPLVCAWGSTETAPLATDCHFHAEQPGVIGLPIPGCQLKLVPGAGKLEVRVRGPNVSCGYWGRPDLTAKCFDEEGFYRIGDAVRFVDESIPERGLLFDGRMSEDFKLTTGTWVSVGNLRVRAIAALAPVAQDLVICGHDRAEVSFLIFPNMAACRAMCTALSANAQVEEILRHPAVRTHVLNVLLELRRQAPASSTHAVRALLLAKPPSIDAGEITDKGYINQRAVLEHRPQSLQSLFTPGHVDVIALPT